MARLGDLVPGARIVGDGDVQVVDVAYDSRRVGEGSLFVALRGTQTDGHGYLSQAIENGASALMTEEVPSQAPPGVPIAVVPDTRRALAEASAALLDHPGRAMRLVGVTGTNGKTSTVRMVESIANAAGHVAGSLGTISARYAGTEEPALLTTPESTELQHTLARMRDAGVEVAAIEVSSHSLAMHRVHTLRFEAAVFTNLTQDHLDFHRDMDAYADAKASLFSPDYLEGTAVVHAADPLAERMTETARKGGKPVLTFARNEMARNGTAPDLTSQNERVSLSGSRFEMRGSDGGCEVDLPLPGDFQIENALAAAGAARALDIDWAAIREGLDHCEPVPGRLERVAPGDPAVLVDYAHTPDALDAVLSRVRAFVKGRLICVFGCGGDRDRGKRPRMAEAACRHADYVVATSDNPRTEDPAQILADLSPGLSGSCEVIEDRREAIRHAIAQAEPLDVVVIAGKGHEDYQIVGTERRPFDDREEARNALALRESRS